MMQELFEREGGKAIITPDDLPYPAKAVSNPGVVEAGGRVVLLLRVEDRSGRSHLTVARSRNGVDNWQIEKQPLIAPAGGSADDEHEIGGCEDARITYLAELGVYAICYTGHSPDGPVVAAAATKDFTTACKMGLILPPGNRDAAMFPRRMGDRWAMLHCPTGSGVERIWVTFSPDLVHWGAARRLIAEVSALSQKTLDSDVTSGSIILSRASVETEQGHFLPHSRVRQVGWRHGSCAASL